MANKKRGTELISDMLRSLAVVGVVIVPLWLLIPHHSKQKVTVVDYSTALSQARRLTQHHVVAPEGLPATWRPSNVTTSGGNGKPVVFHLGYVTPTNQYASLDESDGGRDSFVQSLAGKRSTALPDVRVGAVAWKSLRGTDGRVALVSPSSPVTVVVKGTATVGRAHGTGRVSPLKGLFHAVTIAPYGRANRRRSAPITGPYRREDADDQLDRHVPRPAQPAGA